MHKVIIPKRSRSRYSVFSNRGSTLIEVMVSLVVFCFLTVIFASSVIIAKASSEMNGQYAQAISLCQHKIDQLRAVGYGRLNYAELNDAGVVDDSPMSSPYSFVQMDAVGKYLSDPTATLAIHTETDNPQVVHVKVSISWKAAPTRSEKSAMSMEAYISNVE